MLLPLLMNLGMFGGQATVGCFDWKAKKKRKSKVIRFSDMDAREALAAELAAASAPITDTATPIEQDDLNEDEALLMALVSRLVH